MTLPTVRRKGYSVCVVHIPMENKGSDLVPGLNDLPPTYANPKTTALQAQVKKGRTRCRPSASVWQNREVHPTISRKRGARTMNVATRIGLVSPSLSCWWWWRSSACWSDFCCPPCNRPARPRASHRCENNLKQIELATHNYNRAYGTFPPLYGRVGQPPPADCVADFPVAVPRQAVLYNQYDQTTTTGATP